MKDTDYTDVKPLDRDQPPRDVQITHPTQGNPNDVIRALHDLYRKALLSWNSGITPEPECDTPRIVEAK